MPKKHFDLHSVLNAKTFFCCCENQTYRKKRELQISPEIVTDYDLLRECFKQQKALHHAATNELQNASRLYSCFSW